tara:strand:+ start:157 stop:426 length:270 start_codon:yes stop_codon:yes gene_type:complete
MNRVIKNYLKLNSMLRDEVYIGYLEGELERTAFPYKGKITDGIIYQYEDIIYLIPISTIVAGRSGSSDDSDDDDKQSSEIEDELHLDEE